MEGLGLKPELLEMLCPGSGLDAEGPLVAWPGGAPALGSGRQSREADEQKPVLALPRHTSRWISAPTHSGTHQGPHLREPGEVANEEGFGLESDLAP